MGIQDTNINLLERIKNPTDAGAWEEFYDFYWDVITGWARQMGCSKMQAEDIFQETILSLIKNSDEFQYIPKKGSFRALLKTIVKRRIVDNYRKNARYIEEDANIDSSPEFQYLVKEKLAENQYTPVYEIENSASDIIWLRGILMHAVKITARKVDPVTYKSFCLHVLDAYPVEKVAQELGIDKVKTVYEQKRRFIEILKREFKNLLKNFNDIPVSHSSVQYESLFTKALEETLHGKKSFRATQIVDTPSPILFKKLLFIDHIIKEIPADLKHVPTVLLITLKKDILPTYFNKFFTLKEGSDYTLQWIKLSGNKVVIGRLEHCDISLSYQSVSGIHATIEKTDTGYIIKDEQSTNGVFVNGKKILKRSSLIDGDIIQISKMYIFIFFEGKNNK